MLQFYTLLWMRWSLLVSLISVVLALLFSFVITLILYLNQGAEKLTPDVLQALLDVYSFWFPISWSLSLLLALFLSLKYIFNHCFDGYELKLLECPTKEIIDIIGYGDLVRVWRKWFMMIIWLVATQLIIALIIATALTSGVSLFDWFSIYVLFGFILIAGFVSFILLVGRCPRVKVMKC